MEVRSAHEILDSVVAALGVQILAQAEWCQSPQARFEAPLNSHPPLPSVEALDYKRSLARQQVVLVAVLVVAVEQLMTASELPSDPVAEQCSESQGVECLLLKCPQLQRPHPG